jgi:hypothetical protein
VVVLPHNSPEEFKALFEALTNDFVTAKIHAKFLIDLNEVAPRYVPEINESVTFWQLTMRANLDAVIIRLCKAYEPHPQAVNLPNILDTIVAHPELFSDESFRARLQDNPYVENLVASRGTLDPIQLQKDRSFVSHQTNPIVKALMFWRNNLHVHQSRAHAIAPDTLDERYPLSSDDLETLLDEGMTILNRYAGMFNAIVYSTQIVGDDDFLGVLDAVKEARERRIVTFNERFRRAKNSEQD